MWCKDVKKRYFQVGNVICMTVVLSKYMMPVHEKFVIKKVNNKLCKTILSNYYVQVCNSICKPNVLHKYILQDTVKTAISPSHLIIAHSSQFQPIPANFSPFQPIPAHSSPIPDNSSLFQPIPAHSRPFQPIPAYSSPFQLNSSPFQSIPAHSSPFQSGLVLSGLVKGSPKRYHT